MSEHPTDVFLSTYRNHIIEECARLLEVRGRDDLADAIRALKTSQ